MALRRVYIDEVEAGVASVGGERAHHLSRVARLKPGERVEVSDRRRVFLAEVALSSNNRVEFRLVEEIDAARVSVTLTLGLAVIRYARFEWAVEKATELGVERIVPIEAEFGDASLGAAARKRVERWRRIAEEAAQQCRRLAEPEVSGPVTPEEFVQAHGGPHCYFVDVDGAPMGEALFGTEWAEGLTEAAVLVGPEGGWSDDERAMARDAGCPTVGLGSLVLRAETAALAALALVSQRFQGNLKE